ncbi:MAG: hypothetical protein KAW12_11290 [Candidatus Aminicenantes bacterium]|nr:hypothetical protein [Candidatus Aminicenantes bacterium]
MKKNFPVCSGRSAAALLWIVLTCLLFSASLGAGEIAVFKAELAETFTGLNVENVSHLIQKNGILYILETGNHRVLTLKNNVISGQLGRIGQKKGEFYYPRDLIVDNKSRLYVLDFVGKSANRVQIFDAAGELLSGFTIASKTWGFAVDSKGNVFLGQPHSGALISVFSPAGKRIAGIGNLIRPSEIYGKEYKSSDRLFKNPMNRVHIAVDEKDNTWVSFLFMPLLIKFNPAGELLFKKVVDTPALTPLRKIIWQGGKESRDYLSRNIDGHQMTVIVKDMIYKPALKELYLLLGSDEILVLDDGGKPRRIIKPQFVQGVLESFFINEANEILVRFFFHPEFYKLTIIK